MREKTLKQKIAEYIKRVEFSNKMRPGRINAEIKRVFKKSRKGMGETELDAVWSWLNREYPVPADCYPIDEYHHQCDVFTWASREIETYPDLEWLDGDLAGTYIPIGLRMKMRKAGCLKKGRPDIRLPVPVGGFNGLFVELKTDTGEAFDEQRRYLAAMKRHGHFVCICKTAIVAIVVIEAYLMGKTKKLNQDYIGARAAEITEKYGVVFNGK